MCKEKESRKSIKREGSEDDKKPNKKPRIQSHFFSKSQSDKKSRDGKDKENLQEYLQEILFDSLCKCRLIAKGDVLDSSITDNDNMATVLHSATIAGGLLPLIGTYSTATALITSALYAGAKKLSKEASIGRAARINEHLNAPDEIIAICKYLSSEIPKIYAESISKLSLNGKKRFAECAVFCMLHYVATNDGKDSSYFTSSLNYMTEIIKYYGKGLVRYFDKDLFPIKDPETSLEKSMLSALLFFQPGSERTKLQHKPEFNGQEYYFEGILTTAIKTPTGKIFCTPDSERDKYGCRLLSEELAEKLGKPEQQIEKKNEHCIIS